MSFNCSRAASSDTCRRRRFSALVARLLTTLLYVVTHHDPGTILVVPLVLAVIALAAPGQPAWRAGRLDPMVALQEE